MKFPNNGFWDDLSMGESLDWVRGIYGRLAVAVGSETLTYGSGHFEAVTNDAGAGQVILISTGVLAVLDFEVANLDSSSANLKASVKVFRIADIDSAAVERVRIGQNGEVDRAVVTLKMRNSTTFTLPTGAHPESRNDRELLGLLPQLLG